MDFVTAAANIRSSIFSITTKSRFDIKCESYIAMSNMLPMVGLREVRFALT